MLVFVCAGPALAQEEEDEGVAELVVERVADDEKEEGVDWRLETGATFNLSDNRSVIGQTDGTSLTFGYKSDGSVEVRGDDHEWRNTAGVSAGLTTTPSVPGLLKSRDRMAIETIYLYHLVDWFGPFARFAAETAAFAGADQRAEPTTFAISRVDGTIDTLVIRRLPLTDPFRPTHLKESVGLFVQPVARDSVSVEVRAGGGARHSFAEEQLALNDDADTPAVEVQELSDVHQVGVEGVFELWGALVDKKLSYKLAAEVLVPLWHNELPPGDDRSLLELTNFSLRAALSSRVVDWASVDYELAVDRQPQLLDAWQIRNNLIVTFGITAGNIEEEEEE
jgi:hypothetical protein